MASRPKKTRRAEPVEPRKAKRLTPELRRAQILDAAARMVVEQGYLPVSLEELARQAGASKPLIYAYFATQYDLLNALLNREIQSLIDEGLETASSAATFDEAIAGCALLYFEHVARNGPLLNILMTDLYMVEHIDPKVLALRRTLAGRLEQLAAKVLPLKEQEIDAAIEMMTAIPDEAGRLVFHQELDAAVARQICEGLIASSLRALKAPDEVLIPD